MDISREKRDGDLLEGANIRKSPRFSSTPTFDVRKVPLNALARPLASARLTRQNVPNPPPGTLQSSGGNRSLVCGSCRRKFPDFTSLEYHKNTKVRSIQKTRINTGDFNGDTMIALCPFPTCCFHSQNVNDVHTHMSSRHKRQRTKDFLQRDDGEQKMISVFVIPKHEEGESGVITCPSCSTVFNSDANLKRHLEKSCRGYGVFNCVMCGQYSRNREAMVRHMKLAHPPPPGREIRINFLVKLTLMILTLQESI
jgi:uncharacterized C2H2 Zn-finger protein